MKYVRYHYLRTGVIRHLSKVRSTLETAKKNTFGAEVSCIEIQGIPARRVTVSDKKNSKIILYLHGGCYVIGSSHTYLELVCRIATASNSDAFIIDYRLAPEHVFPCAIEDALKAYDGLLDMNIAASDIIVMGDSAGGGLALALLIALKDAKKPQPAAAIVMSPWSDLAQTGESIKTNKCADPLVITCPANFYYGDTDARHPLVSPLYADYSDLPPLLILVGSSEILLDDSKRVALKAQAAGVKVELQIWPGMPHVWPYFAKLLPEARLAIDVMANYIKLLNN